MKLAQWFALLVAAGVAASASAAGTFSTGNYSQGGIGADPPYTFYDVFSINGASGSFSQGNGNSFHTVGTYQFDVGVNCSACALTPSFDAVIGMTVDGQTKNLVLPYSWSSIGSADTLTFGSAAPVTFNLGASVLTVNLVNISPLTGGAGTITGPLRADFSIGPAVPEPSTYVMLAVGLVLTTLLVRRQRRLALVPVRLRR